MGLGSRVGNVRLTEPSWSIIHGGIVGDGLYARDVALVVEKWAGPGRRWQMGDEGRIEE